jgi:hypothetical protein
MFFTCMLVQLQVQHRKQDKHAGTWREQQASLLAAAAKGNTWAACNIIQRILYASCCIWYCHLHPALLKQTHLECSGMLLVADKAVLQSCTGCIADSLQHQTRSSARVQGLTSCRQAVLHQHTHISRTAAVPLGQEVLQAPDQWVLKGIVRRARKRVPGVLHGLYYGCKCCMSGLLLLLLNFLGAATLWAA